MAGSMSNRMMRLLRTTSIHHSPSRLATAVAVGVLAGLLPKDNLLAIAVYVAMIFMPLHTPLSFLTSVAVSFASYQLDSVCHSIGHSVHQLTVLRPVWMALDSAPIAPWMSLHNSVVLGALIVGLAAAGPLYLVTLRVFEFLAYRADNSKLTTRKKPRRSVEPEKAIPVTTSVVVTHTSSAIIPPPKFIKQPSRQSDPVLSRVADSDELLDSQSTAQPEPLINAWHMGYGAAKQNQLQTVGVGINEPTRKLAMDEPKAPPLPPPLRSIAEPNFHSTENHSYEAMTSLSIASHADEVLTWVDQVLEECLSEDSLTVMASDAPEVPHMLECNTATLEQEVVCDPIEVPGNDQWLMETTIEIVRWADESIPTDIASSSAASAAMIQPKSLNKSMLTVVPNSGLSVEASKIASAMPATETAIDQSSKMNAPIATPASGTPATPSVDSDDLDNRPRLLNFAQRRDQNNRGPVTGFEHVVLAQSTNETVTSSESGTPKTECLGYILEHLRQTREGKST